MVTPKRKKMACQGSMTQKKKRESEEKGVIMSQKKRETGIIRERKPIPQGVSHIHPSTHTLSPFDLDCMTCFSMDPLYDFTIYGMQVCPVLILP